MADGNTYVNGLGGTFIFSKDPKPLAEWYSKHLGLLFEEMGKGDTFYQVFMSLNPDDHEKKWDTTFSIMRARATFSIDGGDDEPDNMYGDRPFMVNFRVNNLETALEHLTAGGVEIVKRETFDDFGAFAWVHDPDGNRIELYEGLL